MLFPRLWRGVLVGGCFVLQDASDEQIYVLLQLHIVMSRRRGKGQGLGACQELVVPMRIPPLMRYLLPDSSSCRFLVCLLVRVLLSKHLSLLCHSSSGRIVFDTSAMCLVFVVLARCPYSHTEYMYICMCICISKAPIPNLPTPNRTYQISTTDSSPAPSTPF